MSSANESPSPSQPLVSVVVPFHHVKDYLRRCLQSLQQQVLDDAEFILVDDGSTDGSVAIAEEFVQRDKRFVLVHQKHSGVGVARNTGVARANGRYLTFVDSDDLTPSRGIYELVMSLESSGSDIAAGNAKRFTDAEGSYQSWAHAEPFERAATGISIDERPELVRDRFLWNKVFRRSFWDAHNFVFPLIRYEDYPVVLAAYLSAKGIDVVSSHVYFWRDRESGNSITQLSSDLGNAKDRWTSANLVLDVLADEDASAQIKEIVEAYLARVDLVALAAGWNVAPAADEGAFAELATQLASRLDPALTRSNPLLPRTLHRALRNGDLDFAAAIAGWRLAPSPRQFLKETRPWRKPRVTALLTRAVALSAAPPSLRGTRRLRSKLVDATWDGGTLNLTVVTTLRSVFTHRAQLQVVIGDRAVPNTTRRSETGLTTSFAWQPGNTAGADRVTITLANGGLRWEGPVNSTPAQLPEPSMSTGLTSYATADADLTLVTAKRTIVDISVQPDGYFHVSLRPTDASSSITIQRPQPAGDIELPITDGVARLQPAALTAGDTDDDPVEHIAHRYLSVAGEPALLGAGAEMSLPLPDGRFATVGRSPLGVAMFNVAPSEEKA